MFIQVPCSEEIFTGSAGNVSFTGKYAFVRQWMMLCWRGSMKRNQKKMRKVRSYVCIAEYFIPIDMKYLYAPPHSGTQKNTVYGKSFAEQERLTFKTRPGCAKLHIGESLQRKEICINFKSFNFRWFIQVLLCKAKPPPPPADLVIVFNFLQSAQTMPHRE